MKIFFDHQKFSTQRYGGISRYFANIINEIKTSNEFQYKLGVLYAPNHYIKNEPQVLNNFLGRKLLNSEYGARISKVNELYCSNLVKKNDFDIFHPTYYDTYFLDKIKKPFVTTIHDMTHERLPEYFWAKDSLMRNKRLNIERADKIIAISETTKNDLLKYSNVDPAKVEVIYHGIDIDTPLVFTPIPNLPKNYLLFIGDRGGYKNFYFFINAFKELAQKHPDLTVILSGGGPLGNAEIEYLTHFKLNDRVSHIHVSDNELNYLYQNALVFVYPSLHEGFGLPILEAYKALCPILLSDTECFREIAQDAAEFFHPFEMDDLIAKLEMLINNPDARSTLVEKGSQRLKKFPLEKSIKETFELYRSMGK